MDFHVSRNLVKGCRIEAEWKGQAKLVSLAGMNMKAEVSTTVLRGVVRHLRGDHPFMPTKILLYVDPDPETPWNGAFTRPYGCKCDHEHVEVDPELVVAVL